MAPQSSRRLLPQPLEETKRSYRASPKSDQSAEVAKPRIVLPQPVELSSKSSKNQAKEVPSRDTIDNEITSNTESLPQPMASNSKARKFAPMMIETTRRSRRNTSDSESPATSMDKKETPPGDQYRLPLHMRHRPGATPLPPDNSPVVSSDHIPQVPESKFSSSKLAERAPRRHSFRVPDLPAITSQSESDISTDSGLPSPSTSASAESDGTEPKRKLKKKRSSQVRGSQEERFSGYLLSLAACTAEKQLREQAMAAYPNENLHEPVDHYAIDRDSDELEVEAAVGKLSMDGASDARETDRKSAGHRHRDSGAGLDLAEMRRHQGKLQQQKQDQWLSNQRPEIGRKRSIKRIMDAAGNIHRAEQPPSAPPPKENVSWRKDNEMKPMRNAASPPMAGENLIFPKCQSPRNTRLDVHQYPGMRKPNSTSPRQHSGLWTPSDGRSRQGTQSGLWMGLNGPPAKDDLEPPKTVQTGLLTPCLERNDPIASPGGEYSTHQLPPSPPSSQEDSTKLDHILSREASIDAEFNDVFVTQVYNYLSLGYPSLARPYDSELSKITQVPLEDLRKDDGQVDSKGYIGAPEGTGLDVRGVQEGACERWLALRIYVREWGRQQPGMLIGVGMEETLGGEGGWGVGVRARKDSWAI